jgi:hypothetical protein
MFITFIYLFIYFSIDTRTQWVLNPPRPHLYSIIRKEEVAFEPNLISRSISFLQKKILSKFFIAVPNNF